MVCIQTQPIATNTTNVPMGLHILVTVEPLLSILSVTAAITHLMYQDVPKHVVFQKM